MKKRKFFGENEKLLYCDTGHGGGFGPTDTEMKNEQIAGQDASSADFIGGPPSDENEKN